MLVHIKSFLNGFFSVFGIRDVYPNKYSKLSNESSHDYNLRMDSIDFYNRRGDWDNAISQVMETIDDDDVKNRILDIHNKWVSNRLDYDETIKHNISVVDRQCLNMIKNRINSFYD